MNTWRVGAARFGITITRPSRSRMKRRFVSPGGLAMQMGPVKLRPGKALLSSVTPTVGSEAGIVKVVLATRLESPKGWAPEDRMPIIKSAVTWRKFLIIALEWLQTEGRSKGGR